MPTISTNTKRNDTNPIRAVEPHAPPPIADPATDDFALLRTLRGLGWYALRSDLTLAAERKPRGRVYVYRADTEALPTADNSEEMVRVCAAGAAETRVDVATALSGRCLLVVKIGRALYARRSHLVAMLGATN